MLVKGTINKKDFSEKAAHCNLGQSPKSLVTVYRHALPDLLKDRDVDKCVFNYSLFVTVFSITMTFGNVNSYFVPNKNFFLVIKQNNQWFYKDSIAQFCTADYNKSNLQKKKREFYLFKLEQVRYKTILDIPNFTFDRQITCIVGPSGSGKTTLLRLLNKMYLPTAGNIFYNKTSLTEIDAVKLRRKVVMLGQTPILYPGTIEDNLQIGRRFSEDEDAPRNLLQGALEKVGLPKSLSDSCNKLSGGEKQRLCMARILLMDAETYLMDEPSAALDPEMEYQMTKNLAEFVEEKGRQLILITHSNQVSSMFSEDIVILESGKIREEESL